MHFRHSKRKYRNRRSAMRILVLGGDGFCGWPTSLHFSALGHEVAIVDNLSRRKIDMELECESLTPIVPMGRRLSTWRALSGKQIALPQFRCVTKLPTPAGPAQWMAPDAVVHFAEQRAAPYSMKSSYHKRYTVNNNLNATNNLLAAIVDSGSGRFTLCTWVPWAYTDTVRPA